MVNGKDRHVLREAMVELLSRYRFDYFVTLTSNSTSMSTEEAHRVLRRWLAYMNRRMIGKAWQKRLEESMFYCAVLEKPQVNTHWHCLLQIRADGPEAQAKHRRILELTGDRQWKRIVRDGTSDIQAIFDQAGVVDYIAKELHHTLQYESFVIDRMS